LGANDNWAGWSSLTLPSAAGLGGGHISFSYGGNAGLIVLTYSAPSCFL
jgi:hypothetical protein